jgi:hypothetical protein
MKIEHWKFKNYDTRKVYLVRADGTNMYKVGTSKDVDSRINGIKTGCPYELTLIKTIDGGIGTENHLHENFKDFRKKGEWFEFKNIEPVIVYMTMIDNIDKDMLPLLYILNNTGLLQRFFNESKRNGDELNNFCFIIKDHISEKYMEGLFRYILNKHQGSNLWSGAILTISKKYNAYENIYIFSFSLFPFCKSLKNKHKYAKMTLEQTIQSIGDYYDRHNI